MGVLKKDFMAIVADSDTRFKSLAENFASMREDIQKALPQNMAADRMLSMIITTIQKNDKLLQCNPSSLFGAFIQTALLGLNPALGESWIVPYYDKTRKCQMAQFQVGAKGFCTLAYRSGLITRIEATVVYKNDEFVIQRGTLPGIRHIPKYEAVIDGSIIGSYAVAFLNDGSFLFEYMLKDEIEKHRKLAPSQKIKTSLGWEVSLTPVRIWEAHYAEMCKKTAIIRLGKYLPKEKIDSQLLKAFDSDGGIFRVEQFKEDILPENIEKPEYEVNKDTGEIVENILRPYEPEYLKEQMIKSSNAKIDSGLEKTSELKSRYFGAIGNLCLKSDAERKQIQKYLYDCESYNGLTAEEIMTIINWIDSTLNESPEGSIWIPNDNTLKEVEMLLKYLVGKSGV